ncbi:condensation domain-containing protein, partial [Streptomyces sp. HSW2009]|uniref:condensation domain-containing protein n=1 Tax=Streptomyces sp. HSW2009 TaxID=3142890 RepID=UPI0032EAD170
ARRRVGAPRPGPGAGGGGGPGRGGGQPAAGPLDAAELRAVRDHLEAVLPAHLVPTALLPVDALPVTRNGKLDRAALPAPELAEAAEQVAASTDDERLLAGLFAELLHLPEVGTTDSFFALGGDSILSIHLVGAARRAGLRFTPQDVFRQRTVRGLLTVAEHAPDGPDTAPAGEAPSVPAVGTAWPVTPLQEGLLFLSRYDESALDLYHVQVTLHLAGALDAAALQAALHRVVERHAPLRTAFMPAADGPAAYGTDLAGDVSGTGPSWVQRAAEHAAVQLTERDLRRHTRRERQRRARRAAEDDRLRRFDLAAPPLLRCTLIRLDDTTSELVLTGHHLVLDGWSMPLLVRELLRSYARERADSAPAAGPEDANEDANGDAKVNGDVSGAGAAVPPELAPAPHYPHYLHWLAGQDRAAAGAAWRTALAGCTEPTLLAPAAAGRVAGGPPGGGARGRAGGGAGGGGAAAPRGGGPAGVGGG